MSLLQLLKQTHQALNSIIAKQDLSNYLLKKRYNRLEYLQRLTAITGGILIHNNFNQPKIGKKHFYNSKSYLVIVIEFHPSSVVSDSVLDSVHEAQIQTKQMLEKDINYAGNLLDSATALMEYSILVNKELILHKMTTEKLDEINGYISLIYQYRWCLQKLLVILHESQYFTKVEEKKFHCVMLKINDTLKYRAAIESEKIFVSRM